MSTSPVYPSALDTTLGGEFSNSYADLDYATSYFTNHFNASKKSSWLALNEAQQVQALIQACWTVEQFRYTINTDYMTPRQSYLEFNTVTGKFYEFWNATMDPAKYFIYQALQFPRNKDVHLDGSLYYPDRILKAQCEQAVYLSTFDETAMTNRLQGVTLDTIGIGKGAVQLTQEYSSAPGTTLAPAALDYIRPYLIWTNRSKRA